MDVVISVSTYAGTSTFTFGIAFLHSLGHNRPLAVTFQFSKGRNPNRLNGLFSSHRRNQTSSRREAVS